jgi:hypothetical protein
MNYYCSKCKESISVEEYDYSMDNFNLPLCRKHQKSFSEKEEDTGLSDKEGFSAENMIKGRIAEALIEELFLKLKYNVFRYGMENTVPGVMKLLKGVRSDVANEIRRMPDFVVQNPNTNEVYFIEVKFRAKEEFSYNDLKKDYPYENCYFVIVSKKHIKCISYNELKKGEKITPESKSHYLGNRKEFGLDKEVIVNFCDFAIKFFENV